MAKTKSNTTIVPPNKMALAVSVAARVQIQSIHVVEMFGKQSLLNGKLPTQLSIAVKTSPEVHAQQHTIDIRAKFVLLGRYTDSDTGEPPLQISAEFVIRYSLNSTEGLTKEHYDAFAELNGIHNGWPYWREYVQSVTTRMGFPPLAIPVSRLVAAGSPLLEAKPTGQIEKAPDSKRKQLKHQKKKAN
jgi:hypothetical protein